ncbi:MAG: type IV pilus secretin PilQ [Gammaproteobacteria bacterium]|nr:type IV pilus secretin PilQ [Gammaproteobacteria bacterium]
MSNRTTPFTRWTATLLWLLATTILPLASHAANLESLSWTSTTDHPILEIHLDGEVEYKTSVLDDGMRMRVSLMDTSLGDHVMDVSGKGIIKGAFPYVSEDGEYVHIDVLMHQPGELGIAKTNYGYRIVTRDAAFAAGQYVAAPAEPVQVAQASSETSAGDESSELAVSEQIIVAQASTDDTTAPSDAEESSATAESAPSEDNVSAVNVIEDVRFSALPGGRVQIDILMTGRPEEPGSFSTNNPPRVALDFFNTRSGLDQNLVSIGTGAVESLAAIETADRTRIVLTLVRPVAYETQIRPDGITLLVASASGEGGIVAKPKTMQFPSAEGPSKHSIKNVDFRRSPEGGGRVLVDLSDPAVGIDIREEAGEIIVDFVDTELPQELERRLDVVDFATPVQTIDTFSQDKHTRMVIRAAGRFQQLAYQAGTVFTVNINPVIEAEEEQKVDEFGYSGEKLSLNFQKISVRAALQVIADFTGLNFVTSDAISGNLTLRLQDVPWDQALDIILQTKGLDKRKKGNVVWVAPAAEIQARERQELESQQQIGELEPLVSELIQINYAKAGAIANLLRSIRSVDTGVTPSLFGGVSIGSLETESNTLLSPRGNVTVDKRTNTVLIQDTARKIREVRKLIARLDKPQRQVLVETRIVEANDEFSRSIGARLGFSSVTADARFPGIRDSNIGDVFQSGNIENTNLIRNDGLTESGGDALAVNLPSAGAGGDEAASYALTIAKAGAGFAHIIDLEISALEAEGQGKIIANPRLITANQQEARIEQGQERIFTTSVLGVGSVVTKKAVLSLTVTPQITPDDAVILDVFVTQDSFVSPTDPTINTKQITTQVLLDNGGTVVIGGIYQQDIQNNVSKVPILGDIPLLGALFRTKGELNNRTELLIFLTPRIISPALDIR